MQRRSYYQRQLRYLFIVTVLFSVNNSFSKFRQSRVVSSIAEKSLYDQLGLSKLGLQRNIFDRALAGWNKLRDRNHLVKPGVLSIADLSQSSSSKRLYVIDLLEKCVLFNTYVAHGRNSGEEYATSFANKPESYKSSLGFYLTGSSYNGTHGVSMRLKGFEKGINDKAEERGIVVHGAPYVSETFIRSNGRLGRSQGCPAVPEELCKPIVNCINGGSCFFMFYPDSNYFRRSAICEKN